MTQIARVKTVQDDGMAEIAVERQSACAHDCSDCAGCDKMVQRNDTIVWAENKIHAQRGDTVLVESSNAGILGAALIVYILPFLLFFLFYGVSTNFFTGQTLPIAAAFVGFALGIGGAIFWDRREKRQNNLRFQIIEIKKSISGQM